MSSLTDAPGKPPPRAVAGRRPPRRVQYLAGLDLVALRSYRQELITEESRVSYWRRIVQARLDTAPRRDGLPAQPERLRSVLSRHRESNRRLAVLTVHDATALPPLPDLAVLWDVGPAEGATNAILARLAAAEVELSSYRCMLHTRIDDATSELISRYRDEPCLALAALPTRPQRASNGMGAQGSRRTRDGAA